MKYFKYLYMALLIAMPINVFAGGAGDVGVDILSSDAPDEEAYAYYDLRNRSTYIQITNQNMYGENDDNPLCIHIQIFQQDKGCSELNFEDQLTPNDTVIYDMDNIIRNNGSEVPVNLDDDSYGFVAISAYTCSDRFDDVGGDPLIGNFRIIDDTGYEYRMNLVSGARERGGGTKRLLSGEGEIFADVIIPFNTVDGATYSDIVGFVVNDDNNLSCNSDPDPEDTVCNDPVGVTFDIFQIDENEERLSCDQKNFACGDGKVMNYGINEDYMNSRGGPLLCEGAGLLPGQKHGYISLENPTYATLIPGQRGSEFICIVGLNNNNGTGSMDSCHFKCYEDADDDCDPQ